MSKSILLDQLAEKLSGKLTHSILDAAHLLDCSKRSVYYLIEHGKIQSYKHGPRRKIPTTELIRYIETQMRECN
jgi:excisionase family DNA binding protein